MTALEAPIQLGSRSAPGAFRFEEREAFDAGDVLRVLSGEIAGCMFRGVIDEPACRRITRNFWNHPQLRRREDGVPAWFLGTYHYQKALESYLDAAAASRPTLHHVFEDVHNPFVDFLDAVSARLPSGVDVRVAHHGGRDAGEFVMRSWSGAGFYALEPHDDGAQLTDPLQAGFEIQGLGDRPLVAVNLCLENTGGGQLHYWDVQPTPEARAALGLERTGYPYPHHVLEGIPHLVVPVRRGDVYLFDGRRIHAVQSPDAPEGHRATISFLIGFKDPRTLIYWS